ncbi:hypothetical protein BJX70DRAFT_10879 [Aspergillus crustosus]
MSSERLSTPRSNMSDKHRTNKRWSPEERQRLWHERLCHSDLTWNAFDKLDLFPERTVKALQLEFDSMRRENAERKKLKSLQRRYGGGCAPTTPAYRRNVDDGRPAKRARVTEDEGKEVQGGHSNGYRDRETKSSYTSHKPGPRRAQDIPLTIASTTPSDRAPSVHAYDAIGVSSIKNRASPSVNREGKLSSTSVASETSQPPSTHMSVSAPVPDHPSPPHLDAPLHTTLPSPVSPSGSPEHRKHPLPPLSTAVPRDDTTQFLPSNDDSEERPLRPGTAYKQGFVPIEGMTKEDKIAKMNACAAAMSQWASLISGDGGEEPGQQSRIPLTEHGQADIRIRALEVGIDMLQAVVSRQGELLAVQSKQIAALESERAVIKRE